MGKMNEVKEAEKKLVTKAAALDEREKRAKAVISKNESKENVRDIANLHL